MRYSFVSSKIWPNSLRIGLSWWLIKALYFLACLESGAPPYLPTLLFLLIFFPEVYSTGPGLGYCMLSTRSLGLLAVGFGVNIGNLEPSTTPLGEVSKSSWSSSLACMLFVWCAFRAVYDAPIISKPAEYSDFLCVKAWSALSCWLSSYVALGSFLLSWLNLGVSFIVFRRSCFPLLWN